MDFNNDGVFNPLDIAEFKAALIDQVAWALATGLDPVALGDFNLDGNFNPLDIAGFKLALVSM